MPIDARPTPESRHGWHGDGRERYEGDRHDQLEHETDATYVSNPGYGNGLRADRAIVGAGRRLPNLRISERQRACVSIAAFGPVILGRTISKMSRVRQYCAPPSRPIARSFRASTRPLVIT